MAGRASTRKGSPKGGSSELASRRLRTIEINGSFYSLQRPSSYERWYNETPDDFVFAVKGGKFITHNKRLRDSAAPLANFFASGVLALENKLGPILWQLPPSSTFDPDRLAGFFAALPRTTREAAELAKLHDDRLKHGTYLHPRSDEPLRYALEVRHDSFLDPAFPKLLRKWDIGRCVADTAGKWPFLEDVTADFVYVRLHGSRKLYASGYTNAELDAWAKKIDRWRARGCDVYAYFDNDVEVRAPFDAINLAARLGQGEKEAFPRKLQRAAESERGVEEVRTSWNGFTRRGRKSA